MKKSTVEFMELFIQLSDEKKMRFFQQLKEKYPSDAEVCNFAEVGISTMQKIINNSANN